MAMTRLFYDVTYLDPADLDAEPTETRIEVRMGDRLRAELEAAKYSLPSPKVAPQNHTAIWVWCSLVRMGLVKVDYVTFKPALLDFTPTPETAAGALTVDPTEADPSASPSSSPVTLAGDPITG